MTATRADRRCADACHYCECLLAGQHEHDHFPIPKACGGTATVCACINCHSLKDRQTLIEWPRGLALRAVADLASVFPPPDDPEGALPKVFAWAWLSSMGDGTPEQWSAMSFPARLAFAKLRAMHHHARWLRRRNGEAPAE